jgi:hypothetical protein
MKYLFSLLILSISIVILTRCLTNLSLTANAGYKWHPPFIPWRYLKRVAKKLMFIFSQPERLNVKALRQRLAIILQFALLTQAIGQEETIVTDPCLELKLQIEPSIQMGQELELGLMLKNICNQALTMYLGGSPAYDFVITDSEGIEQWRWSEGKAIAMSLMVLPLEPIKEYYFEDSWDLIRKSGEPIQSGHYTLQGFLKGEWPNIYQTEVVALEILP